VKERRPNRTRLPFGFSPQQADRLQRILDSNGARPADLADQWGVSVAAANQDVARMRLKMGAKTMAELLTRAQRAGLISLAPERTSYRCSTAGQEPGSESGNVCSGILDDTALLVYNVPMLLGTLMCRAGSPNTERAIMSNRTRRRCSRHRDHREPLAWARGELVTRATPWGQVRHQDAGAIGAAIAAGLPAVGARMVNRHGMAFVVDGYLYAPTSESADRWRRHEMRQAGDLHPTVIPLNLSRAVERFAAAVSRCSPKALIVLDTLPALRRWAIPRGHFLDTVANPTADLLSVDASSLHESALAHELAHAWLEYVERTDDERVLDDVSSPQRPNQLACVQSFVTDQRVAEVLSLRGFDQDRITRDKDLGLAALRNAVAQGYTPPTDREEVFVALLLADHLANAADHVRHAAAQAVVAEVLEACPGVAELAQRFACAVATHGYGDARSIRSSIDECLAIAFEHTGDGIDVARDLVTPQRAVPALDKLPDWLPGTPVGLKIEVGRIMALNDLPDSAVCRLSPAPDGLTQVAFARPDGTPLGTWAVAPRCWAGPSSFVHQILEVNRMNRARLNAATGGLDVPFDGPTRPSSPSRRRFYLPGLGRFLTETRLAERLAGEHLYAYATCNPTTADDPESTMVRGRPGYDPDPWNEPGVIDNNNCWSYACDWRNRRRPRGWPPRLPYRPQPGGLSCITNPCSCRNVMDCAEKDSRLRPRRRRPCPPGTYTVILFVKSTPRCDYHWIRLDDNGLWSEKCGSGPVGPQIGDPYERARGSGYDTVCQHYCVKRAH